MEDAMVTGRVPSEKKAAGNAVLAKAGLTASQAINLVYDRLIDEQNADFLVNHQPSECEWASAARLVDSIFMPIDSRFDNMTRAQIRTERANRRALI